MTAKLSHLNRADGSATYSYVGYTVIAAVNGPVEVQRRDELPEEAAIEVNVRPVTGIGGPKMRQLELIIHSTLRHVVLTDQSPRKLIQITLQVLKAPDEGKVGFTCPEAYSSLSVLPALLQASVLALLSASIPLATTFTAALIAVSRSNEVIRNPSFQSASRALSLHVFAFSPSGTLLLAESDGDFGYEEWNNFCISAKDLCCPSVQGADYTDRIMQDANDGMNLHELMYEAAQQIVEKDRQWKQNTLMEP